MPKITNCRDCEHYDPVKTGDIIATYGYCKRRPPVVQFIPIPVQTDAPMPSRKSRLQVPGSDEPPMMQMAPATARPRVDAEGFNSGCGEGDPIKH